MELSFAIIAVAFAAALLLSGCAYAPGQKACTAEAKICPDGSAVGRMGPGCEFAPCPNTTAPMTQEQCLSARGNWNGCASACRGAPEGTACTLQCVQQCECGGFAGFGCPAGYYCTDYLPAGAADAMGVCRKI